MARSRKEKARLTVGRTYSPEVEALGALIKGVSARKRAKIMRELEWWARPMTREEKVSVAQLQAALNDLNKVGAV